MEKIDGDFEGKLEEETPHQIDDSLITPSKSFVTRRKGTIDVIRVDDESEVVHDHFEERKTEVVNERMEEFSYKHDNLTKLFKKKVKEDSALMSKDIEGKEQHVLEERMEDFSHKSDNLKLFKKKEKEDEEGKKKEKAERLQASKMLMNDDKALDEFRTHLKKEDHDIE